MKIILLVLSVFPGFPLNLHSAIHPVPSNCHHHITEAEAQQPACSVGLKDGEEKRADNERSFS